MRETKCYMVAERGNQCVPCGQWSKINGLKQLLISVKAQNSFSLGKKYINKVEVEGILCLGDRKETSCSKGILYVVEEIG